MGRLAASRPAGGRPRCGLGEHRSDPIVDEVDGAGRIVVTRVRGANGEEFAEVRARLQLSRREDRARFQLLALLRGLGVTMGRAAPDRPRIWRD